MTIQQISVFLENKSGRLAEVTKTLGDAGVNMRAATIADTADFGILRIVVDNPHKALDALDKKGFTAKVTDVFAIELEDRPGGLAEIMELFHKTGVNIEYLYSSLENKNNKAVVIFKVDDTEHGNKIFREHKLTAIKNF
ncbi:amino acid-binding protein [Marispirochaeta aestuarii]|uniref:Amino acid-binding protein n=1 Tax=Marispirochaeta aestuarii TaxID=1963862 RepID=A0A1Y1S1A3_9SPIO|nr:ACT domain-containing protein [Marispirochaeta aestuarii]ORC36549.1 amino acid-binding protein [Marispirochaeta aestuarii]